MLTVSNKTACNPNFQSRIRFLSPDDYRSAVSKIDRKNFVPSPWTVKESVLADSASTNCVIDCTVCGFTDGQKVLMLHICPTKEENKNFSKIAKFIKNKIDLANENLQGFLLGAKPEIFNDDPRSWELFGNFMNFMKENKIPFSYFRGGNHVKTHSVAYSSKTDEWMISNNFIKKTSKEYVPEEFIKQVNMFDEFKVSDLDELSW